jgi:hypothetical protein
MKRSSSDSERIRRFTNRPSSVHRLHCANTNVESRVSFLPHASKLCANHSSQSISV